MSDTGVGLGGTIAGSGFGLDSVRSRLNSVLEKVSLPDTAKPAPLKWIRASAGDAVRLVPVAEVRYFQAADKCSGRCSVREQPAVCASLRAAIRNGA